MRAQQTSMFDGQRLTLDDAIDLTRQSLIAYGLEYRHWAIAYSGGKDSSALLKVVRYLIIRDLIPPLHSLLTAPTYGCILTVVQCPTIERG